MGIPLASERRRGRSTRILEELLEARLRDLDAQVARVLERRSRSLLDLSGEVGHTTQDLRQFVRTTPEIDQAFVQAPDGQVLHPPVGDPMSDAEREFLRRVRTILVDRLLWNGNNKDETRPSSQRTKATLQQQAAVNRPARADHGWYSWFWDTGLHLVFWRMESSGAMVGLELNRTRLLADLITELTPVEAPTVASDDAGTIVLVDSRGRTLWMRGEDPPGSEPAAVELALSPPLGAWRWRYHHPGTAAPSAATTIAGVTGLVAVAVALIGLSLYLYRESTHDLREAAQRVRFVNQVSHELRTPLTNIRLYAELLEQRLGDDDPGAGEHLGVIVSESHRLSRLIGNVLAFARQRRGQLRLHPSPAVLDETVARVVEQFRPTLEARGIEMDLDLRAPHAFSYDGDAVEQVLANLINNVEKYAASGGIARITTRQDEDWATLAIADRGSGVPRDKSEAVFEPFVRLSNRLTEGVSGTGMGLSISRDIARLHGGDLRLVPAETGACFELALPTQPRRREESP